MYAFLPRPSSPGLPCLAVRVTGSPSRADAEQLCQALNHLPERQPVRVLLRFDEGADEAAWQPLEDALRRRVRVDRVAFVGAPAPLSAVCSRCYEACDEGAAWSWVQGAVPPRPSWETAAPTVPREAEAER